jgi:hypothetical protein
VANYSAYRTWRRWYGTIAGLRHVVDTAVYEMSGWSTKEVAVDVTIEHRDGSVASGLTLDQFTDLPNTDLPRIRRIEILVGERSFGYIVPPRTRLKVLWRISPSVRLEVEADDRSRADGLATRLASILDGGGSWMGGSPFFAVQLLGILLLVVMGTLGVVVRPPADLKTLWDIATPVGVVTIGVAGALLPFLFPWLELMPPGRRTRSRRFGGAVMAVLLTVGGGVVAILVVGLFQQR